MKLRFLIVGLALFVCASVASAQEVMTEELSVIVEEANNEVDFAEEAQPLQFYALAQNSDDSELLRLFNGKTKKQKAYQSPAMLRAKAKKVRKNGWIIGGTCAVAGIITGIVLHETSKETYNRRWDSTTHTYVGGEVYYDDLATWLPIGGGVVAGAAVVIGCNLHANSLEKKARQSQVYSAPIIEGDIMNLGNSKLTAGVSVMGNHYTHTNGLGMSLKLNF